MTGDQLTFDVRVLEGDLTGGDGPAAVFIDIIGMPLTPLSFRRGGPSNGTPRSGWYGAVAAPYYRPPPVRRVPASHTTRRPTTAPTDVAPGYRPCIAVAA